jgi:hypothetical protein
MANIKIATLTIDKRVDQDVIDAAALAGDVLQIEVRNDYVKAAPVLIDYEAAPVAYQDAIKDTFDYATYQAEDPALVFKVGFDGTTHTMTGYNRKGIPSTGDPLSKNDLLICVFTIAWLNGKDSLMQIGLTLGAGVDLEKAEKNELAVKGISVSGTGDSFTISSVTPFQIQCVRPPLLEATYIVDHSYDINQIRT